MTSQIKKDITLIMSISFPFAALHLIAGNAIMDYEKNISRPLLFWFLPVLFVQFGMTCLGIIYVMIKNKESLSDHGLVKRNACLSIAGCFIASIPMAVHIWFSSHSLKFQLFREFSLTHNILKCTFPLNIMGFFIIALVWGLGESLFYVVLADKINALKKPTSLWNPGAFFCTLIAIVIHRKIDYDMIFIFAAVLSFIQDCGPSFWGDNASIVNIILFILAIFVILINGTMQFVFRNLFMMLPIGILIYGSLFIREKTGNAWGNILLFLPFCLLMI